MQYHAIPCNTMQHYAIPCNTMQNHAMPCKTMPYHAIPCNIIQYHAIPCNTIQYHACLITADGAYHCPVGSIWPFFPQLHVQRLCVYFQKKYHNPFPYETKCSQPWKLKHKFTLLLALLFNISCWWPFCVIWWVLFIFLWGQIFVIYNTCQTWLRPWSRKSRIIVHPFLSEGTFFKARKFDRASIG